MARDALSFYCPVFYTLIEDAQEALSNVVASVFDRQTKRRLKRINERFGILPSKKSIPRQFYQPF